MFYKIQLTEWMDWCDMPEVEKVDTNQNFYYLNILLDSMAQGNAADLIGTPLGLQFSATYSKKEINLFLQLVDEYLEMRAGSDFFISGMRFLIIIIYLLALAFFIFLTKGSISFIYNLAAEMSLNVDEAGEGILKNLSARKDLDSILINAIKIILDYGAWPLLSSKIAEILAKEDMHELSQFEKLVLNQLTKYGINKENFGILDTIIRQMLERPEDLGKLISCIIKRDIPGFFANILAFSSVVNQVPQILPIFSAIIDESSLGVKYPIFTHELKALFANPNFQTSLAAVLTPDESAQPDKFAQYVAIARDCYVGSLRAKAIEEIARIIGGTAEFGDLKVTLVQVKKLQNVLDNLSNEQLLAIIAQNHDRQEEREQAIAEFLALKEVKDLKIPWLTAEMLTDVVFIDIDFNNIKQNLRCSAAGEQKNTISRIVNLLDDKNLVNLVKKQIVPKFLDSMVRILLTAKESLTSEELIIRNKLDQHGITVKTIKTNLNQVLADPANFKAVLSGLISGNFNEILDKVLPFVIRLEAVPNLFGMVMEREYSHLMPLITAMSQDPEAAKQLQDLLGDAQLGSIVRDFTASSKLRADIINKLAEFLIDPSFEPTDIAKLKNELNKLYTSDILAILGLGTDTHDKENLQDTAIKELFKVNLMHGGKPFTSEDLKRNLQQNQRKIPEIKDLIAQKYDLSAGAVQKIVYAFSDPRMLAILDKHGVHAAKAMFDIATATDLTYEEYEIQELFREYIGLTPENSEVLRPYLDASFFTLYGQISTAQKDALNIIFSKFASGDIKQILDGTCEAAKILCETNEGKEILQKKLWPIAMELANRVLDPKKQDELSANEKKLAAILNQYGVDTNILLLVNYLIAENLDSIPVLTSSLLQESGNFFKWASSVIATVEWNEKVKEIVCAHPESIRKLIQGIVMQVPRAKALFDEYGIDIKALEIIDVALAPPSSAEKLRLVKQLFIGLGKILNNDPIDANGIDDILSSVEQLTMDPNVRKFLKDEVVFSEDRYNRVLGSENFVALDAIVKEFSQHSEPLKQALICSTSGDMAGFFANILPYSSVGSQVSPILPLFSVIIDASPLGTKSPVFTDELKALFANPNFQTSLAVVLTPDKFAQYVTIVKNYFAARKVRAEACEAILLSITAEYSATPEQLKGLQTELCKLPDGQLLAITTEDPDQQEKKVQAVRSFLALKTVKDLGITWLNEELLTTTTFFSYGRDDIADGLILAAEQQKVAILDAIKLLDDPDLFVVIKNHILPKFLDSTVRILLTAKESLSPEELIIRNKLDQHGITTKVIKTNLNQILADPAKLRRMLSGLISGNINEILDEVLPFALDIEAMPNLLRMAVGREYPHVMALITTILHDQESVKGLQTLLDETQLGSIITNFKIASKLRVEIIEKVLEILIDSPFDPKNATQLKLKDELSKLYDSDLLAIIDLDAAMQNNELLHVRNEVINALLDVDMMHMGRHFTREDLEKNLQQNKGKIAEIKSLIAHKSDLNAGAVQKIVYALSHPSMLAILDKHGVVTASAMFEIATVFGLTYEEYEIQELLREYVGLTPENSYVLRHLNPDFFAMYRQISVEQKDAINVICSKFASGDIKQILDGTCEAAKILCATKEGKEILQKKLWPIAMELANRVLDPENQNKLSTNEKKLAAILNQYGIDKNILLLANHLIMTNPELISTLTSSLLQESGHFFKWVSLVIGAIEGDEEGKKIVYAHPESIRKLIQSIAMQVPKAKAVFDEFGIDIKLLEIIDVVLSPPNTAEKMQLAQQLFNNLDKVLNTYPVDPCDINSLLGDIIALMNYPEVKIFLEIDNNQQLLLKVFGKALPIIIADQLDPYNKCVADRFLVEFKRSNPDVKIPPDIEYLFIKLQDISILEEWIKTPEAQGITISAATKKRFNNEIEKTKILIAGLKEDHRKNLASKLADILPKICKFPDLIAAARVIYSDSSYFYKAVGTACIGLTLSNEVINIKTAMIGLNAYFFYSLPKDPYIVYEKRRKKLELLKEQIPFNSAAIAKAESKLRTLGLELVGKTKQELTGKIADLVFAKLFGYGSGRSEEQEVIRNIISELRELDPFILKDMFTADDGSYDPNNINPRYLPLIDQLAVMFLMKSERTYLSQYFCFMGMGSGIQFTQKLKEYTTVFLKDRKSFADTMIDLVRDYVALNETSKVDILRVPADVEKRLNPKHYWVRLAIKDDLITRCLLYQDKISDVDIGEIIKIYGEGIDKIENPSQLKAFLENKKPLLNAVFMSQNNSSAPSQLSMM